MLCVEEVLLQLVTCVHTSTGELFTVRGDGGPCSKSLSWLPLRPGLLIQFLKQRKFENFLER